MPDNIQDLKKSREMYLSNDTVACCAYAGYSISEYLTIVLENYINSAAFKNKFPETGYDVKVLTVRNFTNTFDITICIPFIAQKTKSLLFYKQRIIELKSVILDKAKKITKNNYVKLYINTKDEEIGAYLTVFGSALDKGDFGVVGRGNRFNGVISLNREMSIEASSGKNPLHHAGKIYSLLSQDIANDIYSKFKIENYINIIAKNGHFLTDPAFIIVKFNNNSIDSKIIDKIVTNRLKNIKSYPRRIIRMDPVKHFKSLRTFAL